MSAATSTSPDTGHLLNSRYRVYERIARGGMATVYRGRDERLDRDVALKIMHPHLAEDPEFRERFAREARAAARLAHRNVVGVFDQGEDGENVYLAMELVEGRTLRSHLQTHHTLTIGEVLDITEQILCALNAAHRAGIVHRDIKPENVLIDEHGTVKVADFGLARATGAAHSRTSATVLGTVAYISPEVITRGQCDTRSDLYSLGVMLYEMLTGSLPFTGEQPVHIAFQHVHDEVPAPSLIAGFIPSELDSLVMWATDRRPSSRPANPAEMRRSVRDLRAALPADIVMERPVPHEQSEVSTGEVKATTAAFFADDLVSDSDTADSNPTDSHTRDSNDSERSSTGSSEAAASAAVATRNRWAPNKVAAPRIAPNPISTRSVASRLARGRRGRHLPAARSLRSQPAAALAALALIAVLVMSVWAGGHWYLTQGPGSNRSVPVLVGTELGDAETALRRTGLETSTTEAFSESVPEGHVISANPDSGEVLKRGSTVTLTVSKGRETFAVPDLSGLTVREAREQVEALEMVFVEDEPQFSDTVDPGKVISQSQDADRLPRGSQVHVTVSQGREPITIPDQTGRDAAAAERTLKEAGFTVATENAHSADVPKGAVISQNPNSGAGYRGDGITLVVSQGPEMVSVPDVFRQSEQEARETLENAGLKVKVRYDRGEPVFGMVYEQSEPAGQQLPKGSTITVNVF